MSVRLEGGVARLQGVCGADDAEKLLALVQPGRPVDLAEADHLHAAVLQVLLALRPPVIGLARDPFVALWLWPLLMPGD